MPPESQPEPRALYRPEIFNVHSMEEAKQIILTPEDGVATDTRWEAETAPTAAHIARVLGIAADHLVLDFGCGIGRLAKELIEKHECAIIGADISISMIQLAPAYTRSTRFIVMHPDLLDPLIAAGTRFNSAYAVWALQHCPRPDLDIPRIARSLRPGGKLFVLNTKYRCVPTTMGWATDGQDMLELLKSNFTHVEAQEVGAEFPVAGKLEDYFQAVCTL